MTSYLDREALYARLPIGVQDLLCTAYGLSERRLRYGGVFRDRLSWLRESELWDEADQRAYQEEHLRSLIEHARDHVPYYRDLLEARRLTPADFRSLDDLPKLPVLTKEDVRHHGQELLADNINRRELVYSHTSGTSGKSLEFYREPSAIQFHWAIWWRHRNRFGIDVGAPYATFTGKGAVPLDQARPPYWRENRAMRQTVFTMHHTVPGKVEAIAQRLNEGGFTYYAGYPSILYVLAGLLKEGRHEITAPPKIIFTGAETLQEDQRQVISEVFHCPVTDQYGFTEGCGNASRCECDVYHEDFEFGILECVDPQPLEDGTVRGKIVATGFASYAMPFARYEVGDLGLWSQQRCACGRESAVLTRIEGRVEDYVLTPEGSQILRFDYVFKDAHNVREAQVVQKEYGAITLRIVRRSSYSTADEHMLRHEIRTKVSTRLRVDFEYVTEIEREPSGKFRAVKSLLSATQGTHS